MNTAPITAPESAAPLIAVAREAVDSLPINALPLLAGRDVRVRLFLGDPTTGRDWGEENDVTGYVGRSTGPTKVPLLLATRRSMGGGAILVENVLRMLVDERETYRHPLYTAPVWETRESVHATHPYQVWRDGKEHAAFRSLAARERWLSFMRGDRATK
jgi:hypothetical protein